MRVHYKWNISLLKWQCLKPLQQWVGLRKMNATAAQETPRRHVPKMGRKMILVYVKQVWLQETMSMQHLDACSWLFGLKDTYISLHVWTRTSWLVHPTETQISMRFREVWSESLMFKDSQGWTILHFSTSTCCSRRSITDHYWECAVGKQTRKRLHVNGNGRW